MNKALLLAIALAMSSQAYAKADNPPAKQVPDHKVATPNKGTDIGCGVDKEMWILADGSTFCPTIVAGGSK